MVAYACVGRPKVNCLLGLESPALVWEPLYVRERTRVQWQPTLSGSPPEERTLDASFLSFRCLFITKRRVVSRCTVSSPCCALLTRVCVGCPHGRPLYSWKKVAVEGRKRTSCMSSNAVVHGNSGRSVAAEVSSPLSSSSSPRVNPRHPPALASPCAACTARSTARAVLRFILRPTHTHAPTVCER